MRHILSSKQFSRTDIEYLMSEAQKMDEILEKWGSRMFDEYIMATLFYEPSTRTRLSFETAMHRLGGKVISETDVQFSSQSKWEILADTIRVISSYADIIAIRSKNTGDAELVSRYSSVPIINAWDGSGEHPTQSLLDLYTITKEFPVLFRDAPLRVTFVWDLRYWRTVHSLSLLLRNFSNVSLSFVAPENLNLPEEYAQEWDTFSNELSPDLLSSSDVIYMTRVQKERFPTLESYQSVKDAFIFGVDTVKQMKQDAILMHPLPRVNEIALGVDTLPQARYFDQAKNGVPMRMALIKYCLEA